MIGDRTLAESGGMTKVNFYPGSGDIVWMNLDPRVGKEQSGRRPALVLSNELLSTRLGLAIICPITSKEKGLPFEVKISTTKTKGVVLPIHVRSVDIHKRRMKFIERAPTEVTKEVRGVVNVLMND